MRGTYFSDNYYSDREKSLGLASTDRRPVGLIELGRRLMIGQDAFNAESAPATQDPNGPQVIAGPDTVPQPADVAAIVAHLAHGKLAADIRSHGYDAHLYRRFPVLRGLTFAQIEHALSEALA